MNIEQYLKNGGFVTMEGVRENGKGGIKASYVDFVSKTGGLTELVTIYADNIKDGLSYMPSSIARMEKNPNYRSIEIDVRGTNESDGEVAGGDVFSDLLILGCDAVFEFDRDFDKVRVKLYDENVPAVNREFVDLGYNVEAYADSLEGTISGVAEQYEMIFDQERAM